MNKQNKNSGSNMRNTPKSQNIKKSRNRPKQRGPNQSRYCPKDVVRECTRNYLRTQVDPWAHFNTGKEVCIPDEMSKPSWKIQAFARFTMHCNAQGVGVVTLNPFSAMYSDVISMACTSATTTGTFLGDLPNSFHKNTRAPFATADNVEARLVGCGVRMKYVGKYLDTSGIAGVGIRQNGGENLGPLTPTQFLSRPSTCRTTVTHGGKWTQLAFRPAEESDLAAASSVDTPSTVAVMALVVEGAQPSAPFEVEVCFFFEYYSTSAHTLPGLTISHSDSAGMSAVREFVNKVWTSPITSDLYNKGMNYVYTYLTQTAANVLRAGASPLLLSV